MTILKSAMVALALFLLSSIWLYSTYTRGNRTRQWNPVQAVVTNNDAERLEGSNKPLGWATTIKYKVDGEEYFAVVDEYLLGDVTVYVNPEDPQDVVGKSGPTIQATFYPIVATAATGLFCVVLLLIAFSPRDESASIDV